MIRTPRLTRRARAALARLAAVEAIANLEAGSLAETLLCDLVQNWADDPPELPAWIADGYAVGADWPHRRAALVGLANDWRRAG